MRITALLVFVVFIQTICFGQNALINSSQELKENIHLHLNKTTFLSGERLWFKAYVRDQNTKLPSMATTNLHVGIYSDDGAEVKRKLLYVENGMAQGDFAIDSTLTAPNYTVLAWTNYMRNYKELVPFQQEITVLRDDIEEESAEVNMKISIYPEGGHLIAGAYNNVGILVDNGLGQGVKVDDLELVDGLGNVVKSNITTNDFGMGKTGFAVRPGQKYYLQRQLPNGSYVKVMLPKATEGQIGLAVDNNGKDKVLLTLLASKTTFGEKDGDIHTVALYQDDFVRLEDVEVDENKPVLSIDREELPYGLVTTVLFDMELRPIAHRMFFNHREGDKALQDLKVEHCLTEFGDSLQVDLILPKGMENEIDISLSALPGNSIGYRPDNSIASSFLIRPYVKQHYKDHYFFQGQDRKKRYELDKRLIIEGWGRYDWDSRKQEELELAFQMETGIAFQGRVVDADLNDENQVSLIAELSAAMGFEELDENRAFSGNMPLFQGDSLGVSLISKKGKLRKPQVELAFYDQQAKSSGFDIKMGAKTMKRQEGTNPSVSVEEPFNFNEGIIALEEVIVVEKVQKTNKTEMFIPSGSDLISEGRIIGDEEIKRYNSVYSYLMTLGYRRSWAKDPEGFYVDVLLNPKDNAQVAINSAHLNLPLSRVQAIYFDIEKKRFVNVVLRDRSYESPEQRNKFIKFAIENGYARPQEFFTPNYPDYESNLFKQYGALDWKANLSVGSELPTSITIPKKNQKTIMVYVEGFGNTGMLVSQSEELDLNQLTYD